jgi:hypothetical protein
MQEITERPVMEMKLNIEGLFDSEQQLRETVELRKICYDVEPYYLPDKKGAFVQIGYRLALYGTFPHDVKEADPDSPEYEKVERDVRRLAEALSHTCGPLHVCESVTIEPSTITYSHDRRMRPDVTVNIPVFDQKNFGHPVDEHVIETLHVAMRMLEAVGVRKTRWLD